MKKKPGKIIRKGIARTPMVMQMEAQECGAACLSMIIQYFGKYLPLEQIRHDCCVSRDGSSAQRIADAAHTYGLEVNAYRVEASDLFNEAYFPCVIHWDYSHFVVLKGFKKNRAYLNDPARGSISVSLEDFTGSFTGVVLFFSPTDSFVCDGEAVTATSYISKKLLGCKKETLFAASTGFIAAASAVMFPFFTRFFYDNVLTQRSSDISHTFLLFFALLASVRILVSWISAVLSLRLDERMAMHESSRFMQKIFRLPMEFFDQRGAGDLLNRLKYNENISKEIINTIVPLLLHSIILIVYIGIMFTYSFDLTLIGIVSVTINVMIVGQLSKRKENISRIVMKDEARLSSITASAIDMIESLKAEGMEDGFLSYWSKVQSKIYKNQYKAIRLDTILGTIPSLISSLCHSLILYTGIVLIIKGHFTVGMLQSFLALLAELSSPMSTLITANQSMQDIKAKSERIEDTMNYRNAFDSAVTDTPDKKEKLSGFVEMKNIVFGYTRLEKPLIDDFSLILRPGSCVAIVGSSGSGKSTIAKLLSGLYSPWSGDILFDGHSIKDIDHDLLTRSVAVVNQEITLFEDTIANNIRMWNNEISDDEVEKAARDAQIHYDIIARPHGYEALLADNGKDFSGGQRQRIEIARALAQNPSVLILDEATSALDAITEYNVVKAITARGIKCLMIAHRLSTIRDADEIIVMDKGRMVQHGTHRQLLTENSLYLKLVSNN